MKKLKKQYDCEKEWKHESLLDFSFAQGSEQVKIEIIGHKWPEGKADIDILNDDKVIHI